VLLAAAVLAGAIGDLKDALVILAVVLVNALLGFWQENRAEATLAALKRMLSPEARVRQPGRRDPRICQGRRAPTDRGAQGARRRHRAHRVRPVLT
jgi:magnesium-transporting ATPase (P-type)